MAATELFYSTDLKALNIPSLLSALDARPDLSTEDAGIPSLLVRLPRNEFVDQQLDKILTASGLFASKSES